MALPGSARLWMFRMGAGIAMLGLIQLAQASPPGGSLYRFAPIPGWVKAATVEYDAPLPPQGASNGSWHLLFDRQVNVTEHGSDDYVHVAARVISSSGVDERSQLDLAVDPSFQKLEIHALRVVRGSRVIDVRNASRITALPQETELRNRIYNGDYNVNILFPDVRIGDVVEYAYTRHSQPLNFPGHFAETLSIGWSSPLHFQRIRILSPAAREMFYRVSDGRTVPAPSVRGATREFEWQGHDLAAIVSEDDRPRWYEAWPYLQVSDIKDWSGVARRIVPLFAVKDAPSSDLQEVVRGIRAKGGKPAQQALHALQFVQDQIRYVSISIGRGGYQPSSPNTILARRFGDCKDKSLLLVTLLRELGIEARVALVNSRRGRVLEAGLPTPYAFDHAIVRAKIGPDTFWLDGTANEQFSPLSTDSPANFERALVIDANTSALETIPRPASGSSGKKSDVLIDLRNGMDKPAKLRIATTYAGGLADSTRRSLADDDPEQRQTDYINYIAGYYPGVKTAAPIAIADDPARNLIQVLETYDLTKTFTPDRDGRQEFFLQTDELYRYSQTLKSPVRKVPLAIVYPLLIQQTVRVLLPAKWPVQDETVRIENPAFRYQSQVSYSDQGGPPQLVLDYRYVALADTVAVADLAKYEEDRHRMYDDLGWYLRPPAAQSKPRSTMYYAVDGPLHPAPLPRDLLLLCSLVGIWIAWRYLYRYDPEPASIPLDAPVGIRGWLLLPAGVAVLSPLATGLELYRWAHHLDVDRWNALPHSAIGPFGSLAPAVVLAIAACGGLLLVGHGLMVWTFFTKRTSAPRIFVWMCWIAVALNIIMSIYPAGAVGVAGHAARYAVRAGIYTAYMVLSKRVKATFVARLPRRHVDQFKGADTPVSV